MLKEKINSIILPAYAGVTTSLAVNAPALKAVVAFADVSGSLQTVAGTVLTQAQAIILPILAVMTVFYGVKIVISPDAKSVAEAKHSALICFIGALIVMFAPSVYSLIKSALGGKETTFTW